MINDNKFKIKILPIQKKKQLFTPIPPPDRQQIQKIIFHTSPNDTEFLINFIYKKINDPGLLQTLVYKLYEMSEDGIFFYIPQIVYLAIKRNIKSIIQFLIDTSKSKWQFFCLIYWNVQAFGFQMKERSEQLRDQLNNLQKTIQKNLIFSSHNLEQTQRQKYKSQKIAEIRLQHIKHFRKFIDKLVSTSLNLKKIDEDKRKKQLKQYIKQANDSIKIWASINKQYGFQYHQGITIPFRKQQYQNFSSTLVVGIIQNECSCFNTRKRVPYRIVLETIDSRDFRNYQKKNKKAESNLNTSHDMFLDDGSNEKNEIFHGIIEDDPNKYLNINKLLEQAIKQQLLNKQKEKNNTMNIFNILLGKNETVMENQNINTDSIIKNMNQSKLSSNSLRNTKYKNKSKINNITNQKQNNYNSIKSERQLLIQKNLEICFETYFPKNSEVKTRKSTSDAYKLRCNNNNNKRKQTYFCKPLPEKSNIRFHSLRDINLAQTKCFVNQLQNQAKIQPLKLNNFKQKTSQFYIASDQIDYKNYWVIDDKKVIKKGPWEQLWEDKVKKFKTDSNFGHFPSYKLRNVIIKGGDDLRQEIVCMQIIYKFKDIFDKARIPIFLRPYQIIVLNESSGLLQFVTNSTSIDALKKTDGFTCLYDFYSDTFSFEMKAAQRRFVESLAGYSILTYVLQIKDRHNGNILIDNLGRIIHIDFGFIFSIAPGDFNFETSPFKLTAEYIELMQGEQSQFYKEFKRLFKQGFKQLRKFLDPICSIIQIMMYESDLPCFKDFNIKIFRDRFKIQLDDQKFDSYCEGLIKQSAFNNRTVLYDYYQQYSNGIRQ